MRRTSLIRDIISHLLIVFFGIVFFVSVEFNWLASNPRQILSNVTIAFLGYIGSLASILLFLGTRELIRRIVSRSSLPDHVKGPYRRYDTLTYSVFLLPLLGAIGIQFTPTAWTLMVLIFLFAQSLLIYSLMDKKPKQDIFISTGWLSFLFLISGFAALIYQIVWQRSLFTAFGVNIESITIVVSIFMLGLGIGSLVGGILSRRFPSRLPQLFLAFELVIGIFGIMSLPLIRIVSEAPLHDSLLLVSLATFGLLCIPTIFMGATLPVLVTFLHRHYMNIGKSVGTLYSINTVGSAIACFMTVDILFAFFGKQTAVIAAAFCNFSVGFLVYQYTQRIKAKRADDPQITIEIETPDRERSEKRLNVRFSLILLLSCLTGYISLSQEILWFRAISYATGGSPDVFAYVLGFFLLGIALGALLAKKVCERARDYTLAFVALMLLISSLVYCSSMPIIGRLFAVSRPFAIYASYLSVAIISSLMGGVFPALCHFGIRSVKSVGSSLSWVYFANIVGSTAGPLLTGFVLMNIYTLEQNILFLSLFTFFLAVIIWVNSPVQHALKITVLGTVALCAVGLFFAYDGMYAHLLERLHLNGPTQIYRYVVQNRSGIIAVAPDKDGDLMYGGGVYDGRFNTDPVLNSNLITRAYMVAALHPNPKEVLQIGLSTGSWARVLANHEGVTRLTIIEINPGYIELIKKYPHMATLLHDPKVTLHVDDGRRWLNRNPDAKFDVVVMNTTLHWRDGATNLLSDEFLRLCKDHLRAGGVVYYNATFADDVAYTASQIFRHMTRYSTFVAVSDSPFTMAVEAKQRNLLRFRNGEPASLSADNEAFLRALNSLAEGTLPDEADAFRRKRQLWHITDDNMATEFKLKNRWFLPKATWSNLFQSLL